jgi:hypothetical protein
LASTRKGNTVFLHVLRTGDGRVELPDLGCEVKAASLIKGGAVKWNQRGAMMVWA